MLLGDTCGAAAFSVGLCDFLVQLEGTRLSLGTNGASGASGTSGTDPAASGEVDAIAKSPHEAYALPASSCPTSRPTPAARSRSSTKATS